MILAYALSPIDLIPDFIPVLGHLDDLILVPAGIWLLLKLIPPQVMVEARVKAADQRPGKRWVGALIVVTVWLVALLFVLHAAQDQRPGQEEGQDHRHAHPLAAADGGDHTDQPRPQEGGGLARQGI